MPPLLRKIRTFFRLGPGDQVRAVFTIALLAGAKLSLKTMPFLRVKRLVEGARPHSLFQGRFNPRQVASAVKRAAPLVPGATCLPQAIACQLLLTWSGFEGRLQIGIRKEENIEGHAWVECEGRVLVGGAESVGKYSSMMTLTAIR
jgi:hypothetical protein